MSASDRELVNSNLQRLFSDANESGVPEDVVGRLLVAAAIGVWRKSRSIEDIASELEFTIENLDQDAQYPFMRP